MIVINVQFTFARFVFVPAKEKDGDRGRYRGKNRDRKSDTDRNVDRERDKDRGSKNAINSMECNMSWYLRKRQEMRNKI